MQQLRELRDNKLLNTESGTGISPSHTYASIGTYDISLIVRDGFSSDTITSTVTVNEVSADVTVVSITPNSAVKGQSVDVTISGSGFVSGASVTLSNGSGPTHLFLM